jgi:hypothetical protein
LGTRQPYQRPVGTRYGFTCGDEPRARLQPVLNERFDTQT